MSAAERPSVTHVLWSGEVGGIERFVHDLACQQARRGSTVTLAFGQARGPFAERARSNGLRVVDLGLRSGYDLRPARRGAAAAAPASDVIHLHAYNLPLGLAVAATRRPVVFTDHGHVSGGGRRPSAASVLKRRFERRFLNRRVAVIAANSEHTARRLRARHDLHRMGIEVVMNGVEVGDPVAKPRPDAQSDRLVAACVGRLAAFKRVDRAIEAAARVSPELDLELLVVGEGRLEGELRERARELRVGDRVRFMGHRSDVFELLGAVDVLLHPSVDEPFGLAVVEAAACGALPVVFEDGGGALEALSPDGVVVRSVSELAATLEALPGTEALSPAAREVRAAWARRTFSIAASADTYLDLYRRALDSSP